MNVDPRLAIAAAPQTTVRAAPPWRRWLGWSALTFAAAAALVLWADIPAAEYFRTVRDTAAVEFFADITHLANGVFWYGLALMGFLISAPRNNLATLFAPRRWNRAMRAWSFMIVSMISSVALCAFLKIALGRPRPRLYFSDGMTDFTPFALVMKQATLPSGHAQSIWAAMTALAFIYPRGAPAFFAFAVFISASRFITGVHFISDVVVGAWTAVICAVLWRRRYERGGIPVALTRPKVTPASP